MRILTTPAGVRVGVAGARRPRRAPTLLVFATSIEDTLARGTVFNKTGRYLMRKGWIAASLDVPCHGGDLLPGETGTMEAALWDWRRRIERGSNVVAEFTTRVSSAIDFLIQEGWTDPDKIAVCGTSRGGFMALHAAAADQRVKCAAALAPVTDLLALREFEWMEKDHATCALALRNYACALADRPIWITIGNNDTRVSTECAVGLSRLLVEESVAKGMRPMVELHVTATEGHSLHPTARREAAVWIAQALNPAGQ